MDDSVASADILADTIAAVDIATGGVATAEILDATIVTDDIADGAVETSDILDGTITADDLAFTVAGSTTIADFDPARLLQFTIADADVQLDSVIPITVDNGRRITCSVYNLTDGVSFDVRCTARLPTGAVINYAILNP